MIIFKNAEEPLFQRDMTYTLMLTMTIIVNANLRLLFMIR